ncbi:MAG: hypothetical protein A3C55_01665 [Gammaproteobacteria bacterium RIFCSPHIGHO2_02_FULL_42_13]|nr:MAG: hypothetical protein A3C55_01665 [Gammaproteobacteria bacterium RIFCSPHIGHO2_02_FULL_42_13]OGT70873.1 MAG: hypothetical protein A3H43_00975 [Gammaproteobacteria bacterium RIFCSPLOWO2_02_FULL_42_9]
MVLLGEKSLQNAHVLSCTLRFLIDFSPKIIQNLNVLRVLGFAVNSYLFYFGKKSVCFLIFVMAAGQAQSTGQTSALYVVIAYAIFPIAELCIVRRIIILTGASNAKIL